MGRISTKIMGMPIDISVDDSEELNIKSAVEFANDKYGDIQREYPNIGDSARQRALAVLNIVTELQAIKGEQEVVLDKNTRKIDDLIRMVDRLGLPD